MRRWIAIALFLLAAGVTSAQQPQTTVDPLFATNTRYTNGVAPGYYPTPGTGLVLNIASGTSFCANTRSAFAGGTLTLTASSTNYVFLDSTAACVPAFNTTGYPTTGIPIATVTTTSVITTIVDDRTFFVLNTNTVTCAELPIFTGGDVTSTGGTCVLTVSGIGGTSSATIKARGFGMTFGDANGLALSAPDVAYFTIPYACTISAWHISVDSGTVTFDIWKIAAPTSANPTVSNTIVASAFPALSSGTHADGTTLTGWTTAVTKNDVFGIQLKTVATAAYAEIDLECDQ